MKADMSQKYYIDCYIDLNYSLTNIQDILQKGTNLGLRYLQPDFDEFDPSKLKSLKSGEATNIIYNGITNDDNLIKFIVVNKDKTYFNLHITNKTAQILISIGFIFPAIIKTFKNNIEDVNIAEYAKIILTLTNDYRILSFIIDKR